MADRIPDETLERHAARDKLPEAKLTALEEHLLACPACQYRLRHWDEYVAAIRQALKKLNDKS